MVSKIKYNGLGRIKSWGDVMLDLYSLNTELMVLQRLISADNLRLAEKKEDLKRLKEALSDLKSNKSDFTDNKEICLNPEFTSQTLHGDNEEDLDDFKESELQVVFVAIPNEQINDASGKLSYQIDTVQEEMAAIESSISSLQTQHMDLTVQKFEVENQS